MFAECGAEAANVWRVPGVLMTRSSLPLSCICNGSRTNACLLQDPGHAKGLGAGLCPLCVGEPLFFQMNLCLLMSALTPWANCPNTNGRWPILSILMNVILVL